MIYRLLLDQALTVLPAPFLFCPLRPGGGAKENLRHKEQLSLFAHR